MKRFLVIALAASMGFLYAGSASAATVGSVATGSAAGGIAGSKHNLGKFSQKVQAQGTTEICVFCHTPHHADQGTGSNYGVPGKGAAPLWNRQAATWTTFVAYGTTIGGSNVGMPSGASLACLSCHDGVTTFDNIINAPGPGMDGLGGGNVTPGVANTQGWTFVDGAWTGTGYSMGLLDGGTSVFNLGASRTGYTAGTVDLSNDHPISVEYSDGNNTDTIKRASLRDRGTTISAIDLTTGLALTNTSVTAEDKLNIGSNRWAVRGFISTTATISDLLRNGKVECSSCHDPHFANPTSVTADQGYAAGPDGFDESGLFLRRVGGNTGSGVCRTCHAK